MKFTRVFAFVLLGIALLQPAKAQSPAASFQALLSREDCEAVPEILGDWNSHGRDLNGALIQELGDRRYRLIEQVQDPKNNRMAFDICVARLAGHLFFDATSQEIRPDGEEALGGLFSFWIPIHFIGVLEIEKDALHFRLLEDGWLQNTLKTGRVCVTKAQGEQGDYILTAPSNELKEFVTRFASDLNAFSFDVSFERTPADGAPKKN